MKCILWGTDEEINIATRLLSDFRKTIHVVGVGVDKTHLYKHLCRHEPMGASDIIKLMRVTNADRILLASTIRYLEEEYQQLKEAGAAEIYAIPSYLYRKRELDASDEKKIFTRYEELAPQLYYLEFHAADHCNLKCRGCTHFSNIVPDAVFPDLEKLQKSILRLKQLFQNIEFIRILGGEPFLNPQLHKILELARTGFPYAKIILVTNGLLSRDIPEHIVQSILKYNIQVTVSVYPPLSNQIKDIEKFLIQKGIKYQFGERQNDYRVCDTFTKFMDKNGSQDRESSWMNCRRKRCTFLHHGRLYGCALPALVSYYNQYFHTNLPFHDGINIFDDAIDGYLIQKALHKSMLMCSYCGKEQSYKWNTTKGAAKESDWCIN